VVLEQASSGRGVKIVHRALTQQSWVQRHVYCVNRESLPANCPKEQVISAGHVSYVLSANLSQTRFVCLRCVCKYVYFVHFSFPFGISIMHISADYYVHIHTLIQQYTRKQMPSSPYKNIRRGCNLVPIALKVLLLTRQKAAVAHSSLQIAHANLDLEEGLVRSLFMYDSVRFGGSCQLGGL